MLFNNNIDPIELLFIIPVLLFSLSLHEFCHSFTAHTLGDVTQKKEGRLTLNPLKHIDWLGFICLAVMGYGWAKPVRVNPVYFAKGDVAMGETKGMKSGMALVSLMGPLSNFVMAFIGYMAFYPLYYLYTGQHTQYRSLTEFDSIINNSSISAIGRIILLLMSVLVQYNLVLGAFNMFPLPPMDGSKIFSAFLPDKAYFKFINGGGISVIILLVLIFTGAIGFLITPIILLSFLAFHFVAQALYFFL